MRAARAVAAPLLALALLLSGPAGAQDPDGDGDGDPLESLAELGPVTARLRLSPPSPRLGDLLALEIEVRAEAGVELLMPAFGEALDRFTIVDFAPSEGIDPDGATRARQRYRLQPSRSGAMSIPPLLIEFTDRRPGRAAAPAGEDAYALLTGRLDFQVAGFLADDAPLTLRPARGPLPPRTTPGPALWPWLLAGALALAAGAPLLARAAAGRRARGRQLSAYARARAALDALLAEPRPQGGDLDAFYVALSGIVRLYLEERFALRSPELTTEEFLEVMVRSPDLSREHQALLGGFLRDADLVKFAHHRPAQAEVEASVQSAQSFLEETRADADPAASPTEPAHA